MKKYILSLVVLSGCCFCLTDFSWAASAMEPSKISPPSDGQIKNLKKTLLRFKTDSAEMKVSKLVKLELLGQERKAIGMLKISKGKMRMEIESPDKSLVVVDKNTAWLVSYPAEEFKNAVPQVIKANLTTKKGRSQSLVALLVQGDILQHFLVSGVLNKTERKGAVVFFLQPKKTSTDFKRAQLTLSEGLKGSYEVAELKYWDDMNNETTFSFSDGKWGVSNKEELFNYLPPKGVDVLSF